MTGIGVVSGGRFQVSLACPESEWLDLRRNVFELGGKLPPALRKGLEGTLRGAERAWPKALGSRLYGLFSARLGMNRAHQGVALLAGRELDQAVRV